MAERKPSDDQAAFGVFPQLKRNRSKQDREAAKNVPVDLARGAISGVLGAPGDIESLIRMLPYLDEKTVLPTSEDIEKRLPFRSDAPVSKAASGLGILGGGFYTGRGSPLRVLAESPRILKQAGIDFAQSLSPAYVMKTKENSNWLTGSVERSLKPLKRNTAGGNDPTEILRQLKEKYTPEELAGMQEGSRNNVLLNMDILEKDVALNNWVDRNLANYVKKEMATPDDPVRKLSEEGISHLPTDTPMPRNMSSIRALREEAGFPKAMGISPQAQVWEALADKPIRFNTAGEAINIGLGEPWMEKVDPFTRVHRTATAEFQDMSQNLGFDHILDVLRQDVAEGRIRPDQLNKVSMEQAVRRTFEYDQEMARKMRETALKQQEGFPLHKEYPEGYRWIELTNPKTVPEGYTLPEGMKLDTIDHPRYGLLHTVSDPKGITQIEATDSPESALLRFYNRSGGEGYKALEDALKYEGNTMGHCVGGYCPDVSAGRSRIYSLRDAKGEPHVTVEVRPKQNSERDYNRWFENQPEEVQNKIAQRRIEDKNYDVYESPEYLAWTKEKYPSIIQIKGKQNAKPKEDYLPYVQDFVRSGNWSDVGDLGNTGLRRFSDAFNENEIKKIRDAGIEVPTWATPDEIKTIGDAVWPGQYGTPPGGIPDGMKRGGKVSISNNPDAMMLAVNNKKLAEGGAVANYNTIPDMNDGGAINQGAPFKKGGKVNISNNPDAMWLAAQDQKLKGGGNPHSGADLLKDVLKESASNVESIARGAISAVPGVFGDLEKLGRMGINWSFGPGGIKVGEDTILPTSADLRKYVGRLTEPTKQAEGFEELGSAANFRGQDLALRLAGKGAKGVSKAAGEELNKALMGESSIIPEGLVPQPLYAAPKGKGKAKPSEAPIDRVLTPEEKLVLEKWGQKQAQEAERAKKVEKMAKESAGKSPEETVKKAKASTGKRTATPPDFYRKMAETQGDEAVLKAARAGKHLKPDTSGGYVGAPRTVDSPQALGKMRRDLDQDFIDSVDAVRMADPERLGTWYDRAKSGMAQMTEPYQLPRTLEQHGVYSAGVAPESELTFALKHLNSRVYGDPKMAYRGAGMRTLDRAVAADEPAEMGFKIGEYADKNDPRLPNTGLFGVNDFRRAQGMGYTDPQGNPWKAGVSDTMHPFMDLETALQVDRANKAMTGGRSDWYGPHIQELPWVYGKGQDLYSRGASKTGRYGGDPLEGIKLALQDANKTAIDYAYKHAGSATHEAIPGPNTGHVPSILNAPLDERIAYTNTGRWDRPVPEAALNEFPEVGAGNRDAIYSALGYRQLPTLDASGAFLPEGATAYDMQPVKIARPLLDFPTGGEGLIAPETKQLMDFSERFRALNDAQEAFGYNLPNTMGAVKGKNALMLDTRKLNPNRNLDPATGVQPSTEQMGALTAALGESGYGIAPTSRGATIFPYDPNATTKDINKLLKSKGKELESIYPSDIETALNSSGFGPGVGKYTPEGFTATEPFSGQATKGLLKEASFLPQSAVQNLSESEFVRQAIREKMRRDAALEGARADIQNTRQFFAEADWAKAVDLIRKGMTPTAALAALGYSASSMAGEADR